MRYMLSEMSRFIIADTKNNKTTMGYDQNWYKKKWQRMSGCGPSVGATVSLYLFKQDDNPIAFDDAISLHQSMWEYITPTIKGVSTLDRFSKGYQKYCEANHVDVQLKQICIEKKNNNIQQIIAFIVDHIDQNHPIAFLNLHHGNQKNLESWHWTLLVGYQNREDDVIVQLLDNGSQIEINMNEWLKTTTSGGGMIAFNYKQQKEKA